ncbi:C2 family cysteine protease [Humisphaera borealis]|uniref:Calpain catalytic domain-containing protein n=1 Tax=Humisphaera borealis TaxID=2807512 RepID=A0A7M2WWR4_9BACT|nr:C2 family cysteine protease [Humisphaera borealis]QOV89642.1 hypothetical protein IPV69_26220 [Humisphaera borealis]
MFETLEDRRLFSVYDFTNVGTLVLAPVSPPVIVTGPTVVNPAPPTVLAPEGDPNMEVRNSIKLVGQTLYITGTSAPDSFQVNPAGASLIVRRGSIESFPFPAAQVKNIIMVGYEGADVLFVDPATNVPATVLGGAGDDHVFGGAAADYLEGGTGNDTIKGASGNDVINGGDGSDKLFGEAGDDTLRGWAGDDTIDGGAGRDTLYGADGNDQLFGGLDDDTIYGGNGDDTLVSVFGGIDKVNGDQGWDIFVADKKDVLTDMDNLANTRKSVYRIDKFSNPTSGSTYATELGTTNITDPALTFRATKYQNFGHIPIFTASGPNIGDVQQNQLNDCWLATTAGSVARSSPWAIKRTVVPLGDGTVMVALGGGCYRVDADLPTDANGKPIYGSIAGRKGDSLWFGLLEKGMAYHMNSGSGYSYGDVESDTPGVAYDALRIGYDRSTLVPFGTDESLMWDKINSNVSLRAITITTEPASLGVNSALRPSHAYSVVGTFRQGNGTTMVILRNPTDKNGMNSGTDGMVTVSASTLYSSCLLLYISK